MFEDVSADKNKVGGNRKKGAWKADYCRTVIEKIGCLSEKGKQQAGLGSHEQNSESPHGSSCFSDFLHSDAH